ncbi:MAG TPA: M28 family peptidase [Chitinophagaceae bacterium]|nr:M28 family peptidase [Chitinophagaceae bacterium]
MKSKIYFYLSVLSVFISINALSQAVNDSINKDSIEKTITYLASDRLKGRVNYSKEQLEAAEFLSKEFTNYGLDPFPGNTNFFIPFRTSWGKKSDGGELYLDGKKLDDSLFLYIQRQLVVQEKTLSDFLVLQAAPPLARSLLYNNWYDKQNSILIWIPLPEGMNFSEALKDVVLPTGLPASDVLIVASKDEPKDIRFSGNKKLLGSVLYNVVGMIPGRSLPQEAIIFSAHYDHVDQGIFGEKEGIYNGANDNASGTTAVLALAKYFSLRNDNERTLLFCLFAGEELGLYGSRSFINMVKPDNIKAVINIEMIGMTNATGKNAFMVTGSYLSDLSRIFRKNLKGEKIKVKEQGNDPKLLFQRSDNYPFAEEGIPAHTIMCSDDNEPCYHKPCDDVSRIDIDNMTSIIMAIAKASYTLINGQDTPTRIKN